jgi:hypothetical protein
VKKFGVLTPEFVEFMPKELNNGVLYVSMIYCTAIHKCCCGCGQKVVTPFSPTDWKLTFDGEVVSLSPSIGNWSFPCQSHYWIERNAIRWAERWSKEEIAAGRANDKSAKDRHFGAKPKKLAGAASESSSQPRKRTLRERFRSWFS